MILYKEIWRTLDPPLASSRSQVRESADVTKLKYRANLCQNVLGKYNYHYLNHLLLINIYKRQILLISTTLMGGAKKLRRSARNLNMNIEALCAAPPAALTLSPSRIPLSCPVAPQAARS